MQIEAQRARSRLQNLPLQQPRPSSGPPLPTTNQTTTNVMRRYLRQLPTLLMALVGWAGVWFILTNVSPQVGQNWLFEASFLPFLLTLSWATFFSASFVLLHSRRGVWISLAITLLVSLKLQQVMLNWQVLVTIVGFFGILELVLISIESLFNRHENIRKTPHPPSRSSHH